MAQSVADPTTDWFVSRPIIPLSTKCSVLSLISHVTFATVIEIVCQLLESSAAKSNLYENGSQVLILLDLRGTGTINTRRLFQAHALARKRTNDLTFMNLQTRISLRYLYCRLPANEISYYRPPTPPYSVRGPSPLGIDRQVRGSSSGVA